MEERSVADLTPREIVAELDRYIVGQDEAKRAVAIALRNRWRRQQVDEDLRDEITPKNIIMIGPTGVGKTEIARRLAKLARAPFSKVEASKFTEVGYVGRDVESMVRDLVEVGIALVRAEHEARVESRAREAAEDRILPLLKPKTRREREPLDGSDKGNVFIAGSDGTVHAESTPRTSPQEGLRARLRAGEFDEEQIELELEDGPSGQMLNILGNQPGAEQMDLGSMFGNLFPTRRRKRRLKVREAMRQVLKEEAGRLLDMDAIQSEALQRTEQSGIIFIDELDKVAGNSEGRMGPDVSREGVQRDLLPIVEGSTVTTKYGVVKTDHILFIAAGAFHVSKPSDLIPELQGRFPIRVELRSLHRADFERILTEPANSLTRQYIELLRTEHIQVRFDPSAITTMAEMAERVNESLEDIGARRLHTIMENVFEELSFGAPEMEPGEVLIDASYVQKRLEGVLQDQDLSRYIL